METLIVVALAVLVVPLGSWALFRYGREPAERREWPVAGSFVVLVVTLVGLLACGVVLIAAGVNTGVEDPVRRSALRVAAILLAVGALYGAGAWLIHHVLDRAPEPTWPHQLRRPVRPTIVTARTSGPDRAS